MRNDTPPPMDGSDDEEFFGMGDDDIEIIDNLDVEENTGDVSSEEEEVRDAAATASDLPKDDADLIFTKHTGPVFCCALDGVTNTYAATGGEDDRAFVWNVETGEVLFECTGHKDSVICVCWNHDGSLLATGDMSGIIKVWRIHTKSVIWEFETADIRHLEWHHSANVLLAATADGDGWMWQIPGGNCKMFQTFGHAVSCGKILPNGKQAVFGYENGNIRIWDLKVASVLHSITDRTAHEEAITSVDCQADGSLVLTASLDGTTKLLNSASGKVVATLNCGSSLDEDDSHGVESAMFCPSQPLFAAGTLKGELSIWDVPTQVQRNLCKQDSGIVKLLWDTTHPHVYVAGLDGCVRLWDGRTGQMETHWSGHRSEVLDLALARDGSVLLTTSEDKSCRVFKLNRLKD